MSVKTIRISGLFERHYKKLPKSVKELAKQKGLIFRENPFDPQLRTHKLHGKEQEVMAFWINQKYRIKFIFLSTEEVLFLDIGTHKIYK